MATTALAEVVAAVVVEVVVAATVKMEAPAVEVVQEEIGTGEVEAMVMADTTAEMEMAVKEITVGRILEGQEEVFSIWIWILRTCQRLHRLLLNGSPIIRTSMLQRSLTDFLILKLNFLQAMKELDWPSLLT